MVHDDALDFTREEFTGRIETEGATFGYVQTSDREARSSLRTNCSEQNRCQVFRVRSGGSWERLHAFARSVIQTRGKPPGTNWFLYDEDRYGWVRLPRYGDPTGGMGIPPGADAHGTVMGLVIAREAPETSTSEAAAYISGTLARLMGNARGQVGSLELVRRVMNTADQSGRYSDSVIYGAGLVDPGAAQQAIGSASTGLEGAEATVQQTTLRLPSAYGDAHRRFADVEIAAFDDWNYPFWIPAGELVEVGQTGLDPIPAFREDEAGELCSDVRLHASGYHCFAISDRMAGLASNHGVGTSIRIGNRVSVSTLTQSERRLDGAASGAFSWGSGATLATVHLHDETPIAGSWSAVSRASLGVDLPRGLGHHRYSMFEAGSVLVSTWTFGAAHELEGARTSATLSQPLRAEHGTARLTYPAGRTREGQRLYETRSFSVVPSRRTVTARVSHERKLGGGDFVASFQWTMRPGHSSGAPVGGVGAAWRLRF